MADPCVVASEPKCLRNETSLRECWKNASSVVEFGSSVNVVDMYKALIPCRKQRTKKYMKKKIVYY